MNSQNSINSTSSDNAKLCGIKMKGIFIPGVGGGEGKTPVATIHTWILSNREEVYMSIIVHNPSAIKEAGQHRCVYHGSMLYSRSTPARESVSRDCSGIGINPKTKSDAGNPGCQGRLWRCLMIALWVTRVHGTTKPVFVYSHEARR